MARRNQRNADTIKPIIVTNVNPRLTSVLIKEFVQFKKAGEHYEQQVQEKNPEPNVSLVAMSHTASIESFLL